MDTTPLHTVVLDLAVTHLPDDVRQAMQTMGCRAVLAGGYIRSLGTQAFPNHPIRGFVESQPKDIDIFVPDHEAMSDLVTLLAQTRECEGYSPYLGFRALAGAVTFDALPGEVAAVQVIGEWAFETPDQVIENFDFLVSAAAVWWDGSGWVGVAQDHWFFDLRRGRAHYNPLAPNPAGTLLRLPRYLGLGYKLEPEELTLIAGRAAEEAREWYRQQWGKAAEPESLAGAMGAMCMERLISPPSSSIYTATPDDVARRAERLAAT